MNQCGCCWKATDDDGNDLELGTLQMPGRRAWKVCQECVNYMWHERHQYEQERPDSGRDYSGEE